MPDSTDRRAVGEFGRQEQIAAHRLDGLTKCGQQKIAAPFDAGNAVLGDPERLGQADLRKLPRRRSSRNVISSSISSAARASTLLRGTGPSSGFCRSRSPA